MCIGSLYARLDFRALLGNFPQIWKRNKLSCAVIKWFISLTTAACGIAKIDNSEYQTSVFDFINFFAWISYFLQNNKVAIHAIYYKSIINIRTFDIRERNHTIIQN